MWTSQKTSHLPRPLQPNVWKRDVYFCQKNPELTSLWIPRYLMSFYKSRTRVRIAFALQNPFSSAPPLWFLSIQFRRSMVVALVARNRGIPDPLAMMLLTPVDEVPVFFSNFVASIPFALTVARKDRWGNFAIYFFITGYDTRCILQIRTPTG